MLIDSCLINLNSKGWAAPQWNCKGDTDSRKSPWEAAGSLKGPKSWTEDDWRGYGSFAFKGWPKQPFFANMKRLGNHTLQRKPLLCQRDDWRGNGRFACTAKAAPLQTFVTENWWGILIGKITGAIRLHWKAAAAFQFAIAAPYQSDIATGRNEMNWSNGR